MRTTPRAAIAGLGCSLLLAGAGEAGAAGQGPPAPAAWAPPDPDALPDNDWGRAVRYGRDLTARTFALLGPEAPDPAMRFAGNDLACGSCHLRAGTKKFGLPFVGVLGDFPRSPPSRTG